MVRQSFSKLLFSARAIFRILRGCEPSSSVRAKFGLLTNVRGGRALIADIRVRALRGEMLWASYWEKLQLSPAAPRHRVSYSAALRQRGGICLHPGPPPEGTR